MPLDDRSLLAALRDTRTPGDIARDAGVTVAELEAARDAWLRRHATVADQTICASVRGAVDIKRDRAGVPHIFATDTDDLFFGLGVAMAQDRLWQMDRLRRRALGRQAEILGAGYLANDIAHLTVGLDEMAAREPALMDGATYAICAVNRAGFAGGCFV
jgi:penicillin amidase